MRKIRTRALTATLAASGLLVASTPAITYTFTGGTSPINRTGTETRWSAFYAWNGGPLFPFSYENDLVFGSAGPGTSTNDISGVQLRSLSISGKKWSISGNSLDVGNGGSITVAQESVGSTIGNNLLLGTSSSSPKTLTLSVASNFNPNLGTTTLTGILSGSGILAKSGAGNLLLSGANTYSGGTVINDGILRLGGDSALGTGGLTLNEGSLDLNGFAQTVSSLTLGNSTPTNPFLSPITGGTLGVQNSITVRPNESNAGKAYSNLSLESPVVRLAVLGANATGNYDASFSGLSGSGGLSVDDPSGGPSTRIALAGTNTYAGSTAVRVGTLLVNSSSALPSTTTLDLQLSQSTVTLASNLNASVSTLLSRGTLNLSNSTLAVTGAGTSRSQGSITGYTLRKAGTGTLDLSGSLTLQRILVDGGLVTLGTNFDGPDGFHLRGGSLDLNGGTRTIRNVTLGDGNATQIGSVTNGTLRLSGGIWFRPRGDGTTEPVTIGANLQLSFTSDGSLSSGISNSSPFDPPHASGPYDVVLAGNLSAVASQIPFRVSGVRVAMVGGATYGGDTDVVQGEIVAGRTNALPTGTNLNLITQAALTLNPSLTANGVTAGDYDQTLRSLNGGFTSRVNLGAATLTVGSGSFGGAISGTGHLVKVGDGSLSGTVIDTGTASVEGGNLRVTGASATDFLQISPGATFETSDSSTTTVRRTTHNEGLIRSGANGFTHFLGAVDGSGDYAGAGTFEFNGGLTLGDLPTSVTLDANATFGSLNVLGLRLGASASDHLSLTGVTLLDGFLDVRNLDAALNAGQSFDLFDFGGLSGQFSGISLPGLQDGLVWNTSALYTTGTISVQAVPEPASLAMLSVGALALLRRRSRSSS